MSKLSVITINLNNDAGLQKTMSSVFAQSFTDYEYIIIDGGSTDGSCDEIKKHQNKLVYWVSEKDKGIYHAMNKGIVKAQGEYLLFLNSGDYLYDNEVLSQVSGMSENKDIIYGILVVDNKGNIYHKVYPEKLSFSFFLNDTIPQPSSLIKRSLFKVVGSFNENLRTTSDWEFFLNAVCKYNATYKYVPLPITVFNTEGVSQQKENWEWILRDKQEVLKNNYAAFMDDYKTLDENRQELAYCRQRLKNIENSRSWKLRNSLAGLSIIKFLKKQLQ